MAPNATTIASKPRTAACRGETWEMAMAHSLDRSKSFAKVARGPAPCMLRCRMRAAIVAGMMHGNWIVPNPPSPCANPHRPCRSPRDERPPRHRHRHRAWLRRVARDRVAGVARQSAARGGDARESRSRTEEAGLRLQPRRREPAPAPLVERRAGGE